MKAEIIALGSELLTPHHVDTNSLFLTQGLNQAGFNVHLKTIVGDNEEDIIAVLRAALTRSDLIVLSGGLGPTEDDLTRPAMAKALGRNSCPRSRASGGTAREVRQPRVSHDKNQREASRSHRRSRGTEESLGKRSGNVD